MSVSKARILYIDDDPSLGHLVQKELGRHGHSVEVAPDGPSGLARIRLGGLDLIALDHYSLGPNGLVILASIGESSDPLPVIYVIGTQESSIAVAALKAGAANYVIKDVKSDFLTLLHAAVVAALDARDLRRRTTAAEAEVRAARDLFEVLAAERAGLLTEINHRVGNSLQLIAAILRMQAAAARLPETKTALDTATKRVVAVAQVHRRLYTSDGIQSVALEKYLEALMNDFRHASKDEADADLLSLEADQSYIRPDSAVAVGMLFTELVINALKYAYPEGRGPIRVALRQQGGAMSLTVEDDGIGYGNGKAHNSTGLGQRIITAMANKLNASVVRDRAHSGTRITVTFKPNTEHGVKLT